MLSYVLAASMVLHVLSLLFLHWNVGFDAAVSYRPVEQLADAEYVHVVPPALMGAAAIAPLEMRTAVSVLSCLIDRLFGGAWLAVV